jgi:uncharacterized protein
MKVVLYGATGKAGKCILQELLSRGHEVKAIARDPAKLTPAKGLAIAQGDLLAGSDTTAGEIRGNDAVITSYGPPMDNPNELVGVTEKLIDAVKKAGGPRLLMVGGAGSLEVAPGKQLMDTPQFPEVVKPIAGAHREALGLLRKSDINWTNLSPGAMFAPGERKGSFRLGKDNLIANEKGESQISMEDYAIAIVDELEKPAHKNQRFSVGY